MSFGKAYVNGNIVHGNAKVTKDNWNGGVQLANEVDAENHVNALKRCGIDFRLIHSFNIYPSRPKQGVLF